MSVENVGLLRRRLNSFYKKTFTASFIESWQKNAWTFEEYSYCHKEYHNVHESRAARQTIVLILSLIAAVVSFFNEALVLGWIFVLIALRAYFKSSQYMMLMEIMQVNSMLARLQNGLMANNSALDRKE